MEKMGKSRGTVFPAYVAACKGRDPSFTFAEVIKFAGRMEAGFLGADQEKVVLNPSYTCQVSSEISSQRLILQLGLICISELSWHKQTKLPKNS